MGPCEPSWPCPSRFIDHVAIGDTFATVDLLRAQYHLPRLRILAVSQRGTRRYEGWCHYLVEVEADGFPVLAPTIPGRANRSRGLGRDRSQLRMSRTAAHLHQVDAALAARASRLRLPLIVAGVGRQLAAARGLPSVSADLIGTIRGGHYAGNAPRLARLARPVVYRHLQDTRREAIDLLNHAQRRVEGLDAVVECRSRGNPRTALRRGTLHLPGFVPVQPTGPTRPSRRRRAYRRRRRCHKAGGRSRRPHRGR